METTDERIKNKSAFNRPMLIIGSVMILFYLTLGVILLFFPEILKLNISDTVRKTFASMLLIYSMYRGWRIFSDYRIS